VSTSSTLTLANRATRTAVLALTMRPAATCRSVALFARSAFAVLSHVPRRACRKGRPR
jgi:hypothetical protein